MLTSSHAIRGLPQVRGLLLWTGFLLLIAGCAPDPSSSALVDTVPQRPLPQLDIDVTEIDAGSVPSGSLVRHAFTIRNGGSARLVLNEETCCGGDPSQGHHILRSGEQVRIPLELNTAEKHGPIVHQVVFTTSDPTRPRIELTLTANAVEKVR